MRLDCLFHWINKSRVKTSHFPARLLATSREAARQRTQVTISLIKKQTHSLNLDSAYAHSCSTNRIRCFSSQHIHQKQDKIRSDYNGESEPFRGSCALPGRCSLCAAGFKCSCDIQYLQSGEDKLGPQCGFCLLRDMGCQQAVVVAQEVRMDCILRACRASRSGFMRQMLAGKRDGHCSCWLMACLQLAHLHSAAFQLAESYL